MRSLIFHPGAPVRRFFAFLVFGALASASSYIAITRAASNFYIDIVSGSNSNPGTKASPWKSAPGMQTGAGCGGATHAYTATSGDQFIFKGGTGETWPVACFGITIVSGATHDYWGVDKTWYNGGSWTRPLWDMAYTGIANGIIVQTSSGDLGSHTFDNIEIAHQLVTLYSGMFDDQEAFKFYYGPGGTILENLYVHDWASNSNVSGCAMGCFGYDVGGVLGSANAADPGAGSGVRVINSTFSDQSGYFFYGATKILAGFGGACRDCNEVGGSSYSYTQAACFDTYLCHDSEFHDINDGAIEQYDSPAPYGLHSQIIEDDAGGNSVEYNDYIHNSPHAAVGVLICAGSPLYNSVIQGITNNFAVLIDTNGCQSSSSQTENIYNNTIDGSANGEYIRLSPRSGGVIGTVNAKNNIFVGISSGGISIGPGTVTNQNFSNNWPMPSSEASAHGFVLANEYSPSSVDSNTSGTGANLTSLCSGNLSQLCVDTSGAPWFGGTYKSRGSSWDLGAYQGAGGGGGGNPPPTNAVTAPTQNQTVSGSSVTLTSTCTPGGSATVSTIQFFVDGAAFGTAGTSSPYSLTLDSTKAANSTNHQIYAVCTQSDSQRGTAATITFTVSNSIPGCFVSTDNDTSNLSWTANQAFTAQSANFSSTVIVTPNSNDQDSVIALSQAVMTAYGQGAVLLRFNSSGDIDVYKGSTGYTADNSAPYTAGTAYTFTVTINFTGVNAGTYSVAETSPSSITIATNYAFRSTASFASLGFINGISDDTTPDTAKVCNFQITGSSALSFSQPSIAFGNVTSGSSATQTENVTVTGSNVTFTGAAVTPSPFTLNSDTCNGNTVASCSSVVKFAPTSVANFTGTLCYTDNATGSPQCINLTGSGVAASPATVTFSTNASNPVTTIQMGSTQIHFPGATATITGTVVNGPATISVSITGGDAADFKIVSDGCTASVSSACQEVVQYTPHRFGTESTTLAFAISGQATQNVTLQGTSVVSTQVIAVPF